jgi:glycine betaine/proline transport system ATP-binding protein
MKKHGISSIFVVDPDKIVKGILYIDDAVAAVKDKKTLQDVLITDILSIKPDVPIKEIIPMIAECTCPIAVVNDNNKLIGVIVRGSILGALAITEDDQNGLT